MKLVPTKADLHLPCVELNLGVDHIYRGIESNPERVAWGRVAEVREDHIALGVAQHSPIYPSTRSSADPLPSSPKNRTRPTGFRFNACPFRLRELL